MSQKLQQRKPLRSEKTAVIINNKDDTEKIFELVEFCNNFLLRQEYVGIFLVCCRFVLY